MSSEYCLVMTTCSNEEIKDIIIKSLIEKKLAACIQVQQVESYYRWNDEVNSSREKLLFIKTKKSLYKEVEVDILQNHDYEVPEIVMLDIQEGFSKYLNWIERECK